VIQFTLAKENPGLYVLCARDQTLCRGQGEFDGLLAELRFDLQTERKPTSSAKLNEALYPSKRD
jgi:hypothetical protein